MKLIIGLGNPGTKYQNTRHNAGFKAIDFLAKYFGFDKFKLSTKHKAELSEGQIADERVILVKPQTYMNLSGNTAQSLSRFYKIPIDDIMAIYDDADIPFGTLRIRPSGSAGGHNGVRSLIENLGTDEFVRIRLGIAPMHTFRGELEDYVLGKLNAKEQAALKPVIENIPNAIETLLKEGIEVGMNKYN